MKNTRRKIIFISVEGILSIALIVFFVLLCHQYIYKVSDTKVAACLSYS